MLGRRRAGRIWLTGDDALVERLHGSLSGSGRRLSRASLERLLERPPAVGDTLILADPSDPAAFLFTLSTCMPGSRPGFGRARTAAPLRVLLVHHAEPPPPLAAVHGSVEGPLEGLRVETYALEDRAARAVLARWPLHLGFDPVFGQRPHLLLAGFAPPARALLIQALRLGQYGEEPPVVRVLCEAHEAEVSSFQADYPFAARVADIHWGPLDDEGLESLAADPPVTQMMVCIADPRVGLTRAEGLARTIARVQGVSPPLLLESGDIEATGALGNWDGQIRPFSYLELALSPENLLDGRGDAVARTIHEHYADSIAAQGRDPDREPGGQSWERIAESYREANRHQADHLWAKLALTDARAIPEEQVEQFAFSPMEAERLAVVEHLRWAADRHLDGWSYAPVRDNARKHHPQLIPYADLSGRMKDLDRYAVRGVPALLARSGLGVVRMLIVGVEPSRGEVPVGLGSLGRRAGEVFGRLLARYPDRALVLAADLGDGFVRRVAREGLERFGVALFALHARPVAATLASQPDSAERHDLLWLLARAERHIPLPAPGESGRWLAERAEVRWNLGAEAPTRPGLKVIHTPADGGEIAWGFEY